TVLEVKEEVGLGTTIDTIIHDGIIRMGDTIVVGGREEPIVTSVRALLMPKPLDEIRDPRFRFSRVREVHAAAGVKIVAPSLDGAIAGSPVYVVPSESDIEGYVSAVREEIQRIRIKTDKVGVVVKADALGSLEALLEFLSRKGIKVRMADVGDVSRRDVVEAAVVKSKDPIYGAVLAFNVKALTDAQKEARVRGIKVIAEDIMYRLVEDYAAWVDEYKRAMLKAELERMVRPGKVEVLKGYVFRRSRPAIFGIRVLAGVIRPKYRLVRPDGTDLGEIMQIQEKGEAIPQARMGVEVAISMMKPVVGRHVKEGDLLYVGVPEQHAKLLLTKFHSELAPDELEALNELVDIMRARNPLWAA
ncbi:TPA: translation initiation factor IF-2, partial [Candidatus Bathyarchaeota archaeon]|nr:translation initiation factor IF-2 [Candidatus Bathyarchaeota archaeon]